MLKHSPKHFNDDPTVNFPTDHGRNKVFERAKATPPDSVIKLEQELYKRSLWYCEKKNLRLLELCRIPALTMHEIAKMLNKEFNETRFTKSGLHGRIDRLRKLSRGIYGKDRKKRIPPR